MMKFARKRLGELNDPSRFRLLETACGEAEMTELIEPDSLDAVVCTLVLCSIPDPQKAFANFVRWLKPGGRLIVLEHVRPKSRAGGKVMDFMNRYWQHCADGCQLNRPTDELLHSTDLELIYEKRYYPGLPVYEAVFKKPEKNA